MSNSTIGYSTATSTFTTETGVATYLNNSSGVGQHSVTLTGLSANTRYYFKVISTDVSSNTASSTNSIVGYTFVTQSGPIISSVSASSILNTQATVTWNSDTSSDSTVYYSTNSDLSSPSSVTSASSVTAHSIALTGLTSGTRYYFYVTSGVGTDNSSGSYYSFVTTSDSTGPVISSISESLTTDDDVIVAWTTDEGATSQVRYGITSGVYPTTTTVTTDYNTAHSVNISSLSNDTTYYYTVMSVDASGNGSTSTEESFATLELLYQQTAVTTLEDAAQALGQSQGNTVYVYSGGGGGSTIIVNKEDSTAPTISNVIVDIGSQDMEITFTVDEDAISFVQFGLDNNYSRTIGNPTFSQSHDLKLDYLSPKTEYHYQTIIIDDFGNITSTTDSIFTTLALGEDNVVDLPDEDEDQDSDTNIEITDEGDDSFVETIKKAANNIKEYFNNKFSEVSISAFEEGLIEQYDSLKELAEFVPPPIISGEPVIVTGSTDITISWETDKDSNSLIAFAPEDYFFNQNEYFQTVGDPEEYVTDHIVTAAGLEPDTIYHYQVRSKQEIGTQAQSKDFIFRTRPQSAEIENYTTELISSSEARFRWVTSVETDSEVSYTPYIDGVLAIDQERTASDDSFTTIHEISIEAFESGIDYQIELSGEDLGGNRISRVISRFSTSDDDLAPEIQQVKTDAALSLGKETKVQAIISWTTNELSTSRVYYQQGVVKSGDELTEATPIEKNLTRQHVMVITDFKLGAIYRFQVESTDSGGNTIRSRTYTLLTPRKSKSVFQVIMRNIEGTFGWLGLFEE
ncbi:fibronectin type III domain-containing protein [bacterium]|nr:fibronectin type III domain-containing protein [bacterium]MBT4763939.1 fibronectin type III domain-containing protein [bacterium]MBT5401310.1 fibronectin type III domain-containing protein [bacterium]MBT5942731.1 fibronectin type III domain-containing protein [bacterium]MBT6067784.1 fibronectin type III domain-containing protein [bacterium]